MILETIGLVSFLGLGVYLVDMKDVMSASRTIRQRGYDGPVIPSEVHELPQENIGNGTKIVTISMSQLGGAYSSSGNMALPYQRFQLLLRPARESRPIVAGIRECGNHWSKVIVDTGDRSQAEVMNTILGRADDDTREQYDPVSPTIGYRLLPKKIGGIGYQVGEVTQRTTSSGLESLVHCSIVPRIRAETPSLQKMIMIVVGPEKLKRGTGGRKHAVEIYSTQSEPAAVIHSDWRLGMSDPEVAANDAFLAAGGRCWLIDAIKKLNTQRNAAATSSEAPPFIIETVSSSEQTETEITPPLETQGRGRTTEPDTEPEVQQQS